MSAEQQFRVTLPADVAEVIHQKVSSGAYASVNEVVRDGVRALVDQDAALERWLREEVVSGHADYLANPSKAVPAEQVLKRLQDRRSRE